MEKLKGLKTLKIKGMSFFLLCLTNIHRHEDPAENEPGPGNIKNHKYPFKFLRSFLGDDCRRTGEVQRVKETIWRIFQKKD
jgi:hypothetical protein